MRSVGYWVLIAVHLAVAACGRTQPRTTPPTPAPQAADVAAWQTVDQLIKDQKLQEAEQHVRELLTDAEKRGDDAAWAKALVRLTQLRVGLHGYETAVQLMKDEPWPKNALLPRVILNLYYARALTTYLDRYSWEIRQRELTQDESSAKGLGSLKSATAEQIYEAALKAYDESWSQREALGREPIEAVSDYVELNNYPDGIRGTVRDVVSYMAVELLANSTYWQPQQQSTLYRLDFASLLNGSDDDDDDAKALNLRDGSTHPLARAVAVLDDLEGWHHDQNQPQAELEAHLERVRRLHAAFSDASKRQALVKHLTSYLPNYQKVAWWSTGEAELASLYRDDGKLITARNLALQGAQAFPESIGGQRCRAMAQQIEAPDYQLTAMSSDGEHRRSIEVRHRNLKTLYFRAYSYDLIKYIEKTHDYNLLPGYLDYQKIGNTKPAATWQVDLPDVADFHQHRTYVQPPLKTPGLYLIAASTRPDFQEGSNRITAVDFVLSNLVLLSHDNNGALEVTAVHGDDGKPVAGAKVYLYRFDYGKGHRSQDSAVTDAKGLAHFQVKHAESYSAQFLIAKKGDAVAIDPQYIYMGQTRPAPVPQSSFVYTDRSVYRPGQPLYWKVVAYKGLPETGDLHLMPDAPVTVTLVDANGEKVVTKTAKTNAFGSAAGELNIPAGRLLGAWTLRSSIGTGAASVRVEEYKRPTFEATFKDPETPLKLNQKAVIKGEARYFFGLPVTEGQVNWHVTREPLFPWWWNYFSGSFDEISVTGREVIDAGTAPLDKSGSFSFSFLPSAEPNPKTSEISYRYVVAADVTDTGGETRSVQRDFRLGYTSVEAVLNASVGFFTAGKAGVLDAKRVTLDGVPSAGKGSYRIVALQQPKETVAPADLPLPEPPRGAKDGKEPSERTPTPGDSMRSRWSSEYSPEAELARWKDGSEVLAKGEVQHGADGMAQISVPALSAGAYRLHYETDDGAGGHFETFKDLIVAGPTTPLALPGILLAESSTVSVGGKARFFIHSGLKGQSLFFEVFHGGKLKERRWLDAGSNEIIEIPITEADRGGIGVALTAVTDYQFLRFQEAVRVPWDNKELSIEFASFRDELRPGQNEQWKVHVKGPLQSAGHKAAQLTAEVLAYMYDKSLDLFAPHSPENLLSLFGSRSDVAWLRANLSMAHGQVMGGRGFDPVTPAPPLTPDRLKWIDGHGIGGLGRGYGLMQKSVAMDMVAAPPGAGVPPPAPIAAEAARTEGDVTESAPSENVKAAPDMSGAVALEPRRNFAETAFFKPQLLTDKHGDVTIQFQAPESVTAWNLWVVAFTKELQAGMAHREVRTAKNLMVRPYLPRFLREGDEAEVRVMVNNSSDKELSGELALTVEDPDTGADISAEFAAGGMQPFKVAAKGSSSVAFSLKAPRRVGEVAVRVVARADGESDGELRPLPLLPSRSHLVQSRFVMLKDDQRRGMTFADLAKTDDATRVNEGMVVSVDAQLFYGVLKAMPYLIKYPYECIEQLLNRFLASGIVTSVFHAYPEVAQMAAALEKRHTKIEPWSLSDPNRRLAVEETPWLGVAQGESGDKGDGIDLLDSRQAKVERDTALAKIQRAQTADGAFSWFPSGPPSPYMTLYMLHGFARAIEFGIDVPKPLVTRTWGYVGNYWRREYADAKKDECCWETLTFLNYVASAFPDATWLGGAFSAKDRQAMLDKSFKHWKEHSPLLKAYLALTLKRAGRDKDAHLVFASIMDSAKTDNDLGTYWAPEDRSWLWYNDTVETQAFVLRALMELDPQNPKRDGLAQWLFLNRKLNHWKSTRATGEAIYALVPYLKKQQALGIKEVAKVNFGGHEQTFTFAPKKYVGKAQIVVPGDKVEPGMATTAVQKASKGMMMASATWAFSTDRLPSEASGDFFKVTRQYFKRSTGADHAPILKPLHQGEPLAPGDELEVQLSLTSKHEAEYVHLRDPRGAGFEPEAQVSRYREDLGIGYYEEVRDSGANFFFESLPAGQYTFKYRVRAATAGTFKVGPATVQSMYAPEFAAYSAGDTLRVHP